MKNLFFVTIAAAFCFSCEKSPVTDLNMESTNSLTSLKTEFTTAKSDGANGGAQVIRYDSEWGFRFTDDETGAHAFVNVTFEELCGGNRIRDLVEVQDVVIKEKDGTPRIITMWKGEDVIVNVYQNDYSTCGEYENAEPLYSGFGNYLWTDNNFGLVEEGDKNSVGFRLHGDGVSIIYTLTDNGKKIKSKTKIILK